MSAPNPVIQSIEQDFLRDEPLPDFRPGDTVKVWVRITEGQKTRLQAFEGVCIRRTKAGPRSCFTVRKISYSVGVERVFPDNSPNVDRVEVSARGRVRRSRLYYLRGRTGKAARIKERTFDKSKLEGDVSSGKTAAKKERVAKRAEAKVAAPKPASKKDAKRAKRKAAKQKKVADKKGGKKADE